MKDEPFIDPDPALEVHIHRTADGSMVALCEGHPLTGELSAILEILTRITEEIAEQVEQEERRVRLHTSN